MKNAMTTYWDLSDAERIALSEDDVQRYCDLHLMCEGVLKPEEPKILPEDPVPMTTERFYAIEATGEYGSQRLDVLFRSTETAEAFLKLAVARLDFASYRHDLSEAFAKPLLNTKIEPLDLPTEAERARAKAELDRLAANKAANTQERERYSKAIKACEKATEGIWEHYRELKRFEARLAEVRKHWDRYVEMSKGDKQIAREFLIKAFPVEHWECKGGGVDLVEELLGPGIEMPAEKSNG